MGISKKTKGGEEEREIYPYPFFLGGGPNKAEGDFDASAQSCGLCAGEGTREYTGLHGKKARKNWRNEAKNWQIWDQLQPPKCTAKKKGKIYQRIVKLFVMGMRTAEKK